ncbi:hypothetical protein DIS12_04615 [Leuconostoc citreum]|uniref:hypothetical protein n=1 Tax=Leuconostoc citreum TaxID=33964 RepID=UPI00111DEC89|nr:hypothetical protein [Leuconostoc citreum]TOY70743.1 hypothetical protein DIS12_04615 [Leuconostoc citreum]
MQKFKFTRGLVVKLLILFIALPLVIQMHWLPFYQLAKVLTPGSSSDWLQFWGSYLGVMPSGLIAVFVASYQIESAQNQIDEARKEDLIIMRNTKIVDYLYEIKNALSKSEVILNTDKPLSLDVDMYNYLQTPEHIIFEDLNWKELKNQNNRLYFLSKIIFDEVKDERFYTEMNNYTTAIKSINSFIVLHERLNCGNGNDGEHHDTDINFRLPDMVSIINRLFVIVNRKINELSA